jgi:hypothetical protein
MKLTAKDLEVYRRYESAVPDLLGDLHQRMKYVMALLHKQGPEAVGNDLWHAIWDLETEVRFYEPRRPPFGQREQTKASMPIRGNQSERPSRSR